MPEPSTSRGHGLVHGHRQSDYGDPNVNLTRTAQMWAALVGAPITAEQVALMMIALKVSRLWHKVTPDSLDDIDGYSEIIRLLGGGAEPMGENTRACSRWQRDEGRPVRPRTLSASSIDSYKGCPARFAAEMSKIRNESAPGLYGTALHATLDDYIDTLYGPDGFHRPRPASPANTTWRCSSTCGRRTSG